MRTLFIATALAGGLVCAAPASAQIDFVEHALGATHLSAQSGNGGLTVGVAPTGEITVLSWPSPSFHDQVEYRTANGANARALPHLGADDSDGVFGGLWVEVEGGERSLTWLRDAPWEHHQRYQSDHSAAVRQLATHAGLGLTVTEWTAIDASRDVLLRRARIERHEGSPVIAAWYVLYENLAPSTSEPLDLAETRIPDDAANDFAAYWDTGIEALLHFRPDAVDYGALDPVLIQPWTIGDSWAAVGLPSTRAVVNALGEGSYLAIGGATSPTGVFVGSEDDGDCDGDEAWVWTPASALEAATWGVPTGVGSPIAGCDANAVLAWPMPLDGDVDVFIAAGASALEVSVRLADARADGFLAALERTDAANAAWLDGLAMPVGFGGPDEDEVIAFSKRWALSVRQGTDRDTGAIVASIATQPSYHADWPRDSAFFDFALDVSGQFDQVSKHHAFLDATQNKAAVLGGTVDAPLLASPPGAWLMHFYADGTPATLLVNRYEIDQVGLALWDFWSHALYAPNESKARDVLAARWPAIRMAAQLLAGCVDEGHPSAVASEGEIPAGYPSWWPVYQALLGGAIPEPGARAAAIAAGDWEALRPCRAVEDDNLINSVSLYSTHVTRLGLLSAARAARALCIEDPVVDYWEQRAHELGAVALGLYYDAASGWTERGDWLLWPAPIDIDPSLHSAFSSAATEEERAVEVAAFVRTARADAARTWQAEVDDAVSLRTEGAAYENKKTLNLARALPGLDLERWARLVNREHIRRLAVDLPMPGTRHVGEVFVTLDTDGDGIGDTADHRTAQPHLWSATLTYLSAMAVARPDLFEIGEASELDLTCATGEEPELQDTAPACGADCQSSLGGRARSGAGLLVALCALLVRRRRR